MPFERRLQPEVVQHARAQPEGQVAYGSEHVVDELLAFGDGRRQPGGRSLHAPELHAQPGEHLRDVIVQLARQILPLLFLRIHQLL